ncbi:MAG: HAD-IIIA family hydrolase [Polyangiaceae bacterium]|nr:HAD-IIIA family hydrolase [Polyangiaceae bacterium]
MSGPGGGGGRRGVVLDRDGTLVDFVRDAELGVVTPAFHPSQLRLLPGVVAGLTRLQAAGYALAIATNQPGAAKGELARAAILATNDALAALLAGHGLRIEAFEVCLHHPEGGPGGEPELVRACACRKPRPGMLDRIVGALGLERGTSWMVGDAAMDVAAARAAGLRAGLLMQPGRCELCPLRDVPAPGTEASSASGALRPDLAEPRLDLLAERIVALG